MVQTFSIEGSTSWLLLLVCGQRQRWILQERFSLWASHIIMKHLSF